MYYKLPPKSHIITNLDLTEEQWQLVSPLIPPPSTALRGRPPIDDRAVLNAVLWKERHHAPWADIPPGFPSWQTCYRRYQQWNRLGVYLKIKKTLFHDLRKRGGFDILDAIENKRVIMKPMGRRLFFLIHPNFCGTWQISLGIVMMQNLRRVLPNFNLYIIEIDPHDSQL